MPEITPKVAPSPTIQAQTQMTPKPVAEAPKPSENLPDPKVEEAKRLELFAKRERMVRMRAKQVEDQQRAFQQREADLKAREEKLNGLQEWETRAQDPKGLLDWANERGLTTEQLTQAMLDPGRMTDNQLFQLRKEIQSLKTAQEKQAEAQAQAQSESYQQALEVIRSDAKDFIDAEANNYPLFMEEMKAFGEEKPDEYLRDYIQEYHERYKKVLTVDQAMSLIEKELTETYVRGAKYKKIQDIINANANQTLEQRKTPTPQAPPPMTTITHAQITQSNQSRKYTTKERVDRAKLIAEGKNPDVI